MEKTFQTILLCEQIKEGINIMVETVELMEKVEKNNGSVLEKELLKSGLLLVAEKLNDLLGKVYAMKDEELLNKLSDEVRAEIAGKEEYLVVAMMIAGGLL